MRALLVAAAPVAGSESLVAQLAPTFELVIAIDAGGTVCLQAGVTPDIVLGDFDSLPAEHLERLASMGVKVAAFPRKKDSTDLELALDEARRLGVTELVLTCATSERLDHTLAVLGALSRAADLHPEILEPELAGWVLAGGGRTSVTLNGMGASVSLIAIAGSSVVSASGVEWPLQKATLQPLSGFGVSNLITAQTGALLTAHEGVLLVLAPSLVGTPRATSL